MISFQKKIVFLVIFVSAFVGGEKCSVLSESQSKHFSSQNPHLKIIREKLHEPPPICPLHNHQNHGEKMDKASDVKKSTVFFSPGEIGSRNKIYKNSYIHYPPPETLQSYQVIPKLNAVSTADLYQNQPICSCQNCQCRNQVSSCGCPTPQNYVYSNNPQVFQSQYRPSKTCINPNYNCQFLTSPNVNRVKRNLSCNQKTSNCQNCECSTCQCLPKICKDSTCRTKRDLDNFGQSVNNFFTNLFPKQFKDFHQALVHMNGPTNKPRLAKPPQKFSLLDQLQNIHQRNNPQFYSSPPKLGQKVSLVNDVHRKPAYHNPFKKPVQNFIPIPKNSILNKNLPNLGKNNENSVNPVLAMKYKKLRSELESTLGQNTPSKTKTKQSTIFPVRSSSKNEVDQKLLLRKLKLLNGNLLNQNLDEQCTDYMKKCLVPVKSNPNRIKFSPRNGGFVSYDEEDPMRKKRTIILSSDELDLPPHYEIEVVSEEEPQDQILGNRNQYYYPQSYVEGEENDQEECSYESPDEENDFEQLEGYNENAYSPEPILQAYQPPVLPRKYPSFLTKPVYKSVLPSFQKPDVIIGKSVIKKAVQEELNNYQKKVEREQKLKELKERRNNPFGYRKNGVPQNPMFMLFNAPVDFLRHFHNLNKKSINPVMTTLPNLVYTAKKYFRNFGKDFKNNCMNLASNIIGDFDNVNPSVIESVVQPNFQKRYKRELENDENTKNDLPRKKMTSEDSATSKDLTMSLPKSKDIKISEEANSNLKNSQNFRVLASPKVRKKRYVIKVVDSDEVQSQVEEYLTQKLNFKPLFENRFAGHKPVVQPQHTMPEDDYDYFLESEEKPSKKKVQIKKVKPRVIIDNKGLAFMEYNGIKRPLLFSRKKTGNILRTDENISEEKEGKIDMLIQRAKEQTDLVGNVQTSIVPQKVIKERITHLLNEIDYLVNSKLETYDVVCEDLIKIHQIKISVEEDWKRMLIDNKIDDIDGKIEILEKFKDLQNNKNEAIKHIAETLQKNNSEFVRKILISILAKLQRLQSLITTVVEDFETRFQMKTPFNTKKEIKFVDYLGELKFINEKTRNDLVKNIGKKRDEEVQKDIDILNKLKKLLHFEEDTEKLENISKIIWEMMNACKMQKDTVKEMNKKLKRNHNVKKELKILFDLQNRFDEASTELQDSLAENKGVKLDNNVLKKGDKPARKDIKEILADIKKRQEEWLKKFKKN